MSDPQEVQEPEENNELFRDYHPLTAASQYKPKVLKTETYDLEHFPSPFLRVTERSELVKEVCKLLGKQGTDDAVKTDALRVLKHCTLSPTLVGIMIHEALPQLLCSILSSLNSDTGKSYVLEILLALSESTYRPDLYRQLAMPVSLGHIAMTLQTLLAGSNRMLCRQVRNDLLFLILSMCHNFTVESLEDMRASTLMALLTDVYMAPEMKDRRIAHPLVRSSIHEVIDIWPCRLIARMILKQRWCCLMSCSFCARAKAIWTTFSM